MRFRGVVLIAALALGLSVCVGGPTADGIPPQELSQRIHANTRLQSGSCGTPVVVPKTVAQWVGNATGLVRGKVLKLERGVTGPNDVRLAVRIKVTTSYGTAKFPADTEVLAQIVLWNQGNEEQAWKDWGESLTFLRFSDQTEALFAVQSKYGTLLAGHLCFPILFGTDAGHGFLGGTDKGVLDTFETTARNIVEPPPPPTTTTTTTKPPTSSTTTTTTTTTTVPPTSTT